MSDEYERRIKDLPAAENRKRFQERWLKGVPVRARHNAPSMGSTALSGVFSAGNSQRTDAMRASRTGGTFSNMLPAKAMGGVQSWLCETRRRRRITRRTR